MAERFLANGPAPWGEEELQHYRYFVTDLLDDLRAPRSEFEAKVIVGALHEALGEFYFRAHGQWSSKRKHVPRQFARTDAALGERWVQAFSAAWAGEPAQLLKLGEDILGDFGGPLFEGYRREAPPNWRLKLDN
jgi:hypothetical protein